MLSPLVALGILALSAAAVALAIAILRARRKCLSIVRCAAAATPAQLDQIYTLVERTGTVAANGYVLARTLLRSEETRCLVPIPKDLADFPWAGQVIEITADEQVRLRFVETQVAAPTLLGQVYRPVEVPRHQTRNASKSRNSFAPERLVARSPELLAQLRVLSPRYPVELLSYLLCVGRASHEFEPIDQVRIGSSPAWVQDPEPQRCDVCGQRMRLVLQIPGTVISRSAFHRGTFYLFGCASHPDQTKTLGQFT